MRRVWMMLVLLGLVGCGTNRVSDLDLNLKLAKKPIDQNTKAWRCHEKQGSSKECTVTVKPSSTANKCEFEVQGIIYITRKTESIRWKLDPQLVSNGFSFADDPMGKRAIHLYSTNLGDVDEVFTSPPIELFRKPHMDGGDFVWEVIDGPSGKQRRQKVFNYLIRAKDSIDLCELDPVIVNQD